MPAGGDIYSNNRNIYLLQQFYGRSKRLAYVSTCLERKTKYRVDNQVVLLDYLSWAAGQGVDLVDLALLRQVLQVIVELVRRRFRVVNTRRVAKEFQVASSDKTITAIVARTAYSQDSGTAFAKVILDEVMSGLGN